MVIPKTTYETNTHTLSGMFSLIMIMTYVGMSFTTLAILITGNIWVSMAALLGSMYVTFGMFSGPGEYMFDSEGVYKHVRPFLRYRWFKYEQKKFFKWDDIKSYKAGKDMMRSLQEVEFLKIILPGQTWQITDEKNKENFARFRDGFVQAIEILNQRSETPEAANTVPGTPLTVHQEKTIVAPVTHHSHIIGHDKTFYETAGAKIFFWVMMMFFGGLLAFLFIHPQYIKWTTIFRFGFVIFPGIAYVGYRIYGKKK